MSVYVLSRRPLLGLLFVLGRFLAPANALSLFGMPLCVLPFSFAVAFRSSAARPWHL